ncbi:MAG: NAD(P)-dependent oxidoreductase [Pseudomonadota bacterium]
MTTLITGAGIIGSHTARLLAERGEQAILMDLRPAHAAIASIVEHPLVSIVEGDVTDFDALMALSRARGVTRIVHTAALLSTAIRQDPLAGIRVNVMGTANVLEAARQLQLARVVIASSTTVGYPVFGDFHGEAFPEDFEMRSVAHRPGSIYAATKVTGEHLALVYRDLYGVSVAVLRYAAVIGAWQGPGTSVPGRVLSSLLAPARQGRVAVLDDPYTSWKGGEEFIDARDCAQANVDALQAASPAQGVYHIGLGTLATFDEFVQAVRHLYPALAIEQVVQPAGGFAGFPHVRTSASDISAAARELGWTPAHSLADSIRHFAPLLG